MNGTEMRYIATRLFDTPLALHPGKATAILAGIGGRVLGNDIIVDGPTALDHIAFSSGRLTEQAGRLSDSLGRRFEAEKRDVLDVLGSVAIIPVEGSLIHKGKWVGTSSGETSYEGLQTLIRQARTNRAVKGVVFEIDSPGGEVSGAFDTAAMIRQLSAEKPTIAILTDHALSAGYLLASAAREIVVPETGRAGSIGVMVVHADRSKAMEARGIKTTVITAGRFKGEANPFEAISDEVIEKIRADLETGRQAFARAVAEGRGSRMTFEAALATEADDFRGSDALSLGLVDAVGHSSEAFDAFVRSINASAQTRAYFLGGPSMTTPALAAARAAASGSEAVESFTAAQVEAARAEGVASGRAEGERAGRTAERTRIAAILDGEKAQGRDALARHFAFKTDMDPEAAAAALDASPVTGASAKSPLDAAMSSRRDGYVGPGGERNAATTPPKMIDTAGIYAKRAAGR